MASYLEETLNKWGITSRQFGGSDFAIRFDVRIEISLLVIIHSWLDLSLILILVPWII